MRVLIAPNAFKGSLTAADAAAAIARGVRRAAPRARVALMPVADGGDGLMEVLLRRWGGRRRTTIVTGPIGRRRRADYALIHGGRTAVIEMARASGIAGLRPSELDAMHATSYGTGELIGDALDLGVQRVIVGLGGSATNDGGAGMAEALGARLWTRQGRPLRRGAAALARLCRVDASRMHPRLRKVRVTAVSDVRNPLLGPLGSARVFGPQKGATASQVRAIESALANYARVLRRDLGIDVARAPGGGAAGGLGAGLIAFLRARVVGGARWVLDALDADRAIRAADLVITGEGRLDRQSFYGKAPVELARAALRRRVPAAFVCGSLESGLAAELESIDAPAIYPLAEPGEDARRVMIESAPRLAARARQLMEDFLCEH